MKSFLLQILGYVVATVGLLYGIGIFAGPETDAFYLRFTSPKQGSLVLGNSRAAQGIIPATMNPITNTSNSYEPLYNFSFTIGSSPYGEPYYRSLLRKFNAEKEKKSLFILAVDPWSISTYSLDTTGSSAKFREYANSPNNMHFVDLSPNPEYLMKNVDNRAMVMVRYFRPTNMKVMEDGSLAVRVSRTKKEFENQLRLKVKIYEKNAKANRFSPDRFAYLEKTIDTLRQHGDVVLVRIPIHPQMLKVEKSFMPNFDQKMAHLSLQFGIPYFNHVDEGFRYATTDGNHLTRQSAIRFSAHLAQEIKSWLHENPAHSSATMRAK